MPSVQGLSGLIPPPTSTGSGAGILDQADFLEIMIAEIANQDPFEPLDNREFLGQLTQMQTLQATTALTEGLEAIVLGQQISSAGGLIGRAVRGVAPNGLEVVGTVDRVVVQGGGVLLGVGELTLPLERVTEVTESPTTEDPVAE